MHEDTAMTPRLKMVGHRCGDTTTRGCLEISFGVDFRNPAECTIQPGELNVTNMYIDSNSIELQNDKSDSNPSITFLPFATLPWCCPLRDVE